MVGEVFARRLRPKMTATSMPVARRLPKATIRRTSPHCAARDAGYRVHRANLHGCVLKAAVESVCATAVSAMPKSVNGHRAAVRKQTDRFPGRLAPLLRRCLRNKAGGPTGSRSDRRPHTQRPDVPNESRAECEASCACGTQACRLGHPRSMRVCGFKAPSRIVRADSRRQPSTNSRRGAVTPRLGGSLALP